MVNGKQNSFNILNAFSLISVLPLQIYLKKKNYYMLLTSQKAQIINTLF